MEEHEKDDHQEVKHLNQLQHHLVESRVELNGEVEVKENEMVEAKVFPWVFLVVCYLVA